MTHSHPDVAYRLRDVVCQRGGRTIIEGITLDVRHGEILALVGPNGAGKSTLLAAMSGDLPVTAGRVELDGRLVSDWSPRDVARRRSVLLQANHVSFSFTVRDVVQMGRAPWTAVSTIEDDERVVGDAMTAADVLGFADRSFQALSGGEKARASLARVLAQDTPIVLLDEPTAALDLRHQEEVMVVARQLADRGKAVVVVLHDLSLAAAWADEVAMIHHGRLSHVGPPEEVITVDRIAEVYGIDVHLLTDPDGRMVVVPRRGHSDTASPRT